MSFVTVEISETDINWQITTLTLFLKECSMELRMVSSLEIIMGILTSGAKPQEVLFQR